MPQSLDASLVGVIALDGTTVIGMERVFGDGVLSFYIQDVAVDPAYQGRGIGRRIVDTLLAWIRATAPAHACIGLFATDATIPSTSAPASLAVT